MAICSMRDSRGCGTAKGRTIARDEYSTVDCSALLPFIYLYVLSACILHNNLLYNPHRGWREKRSECVYSTVIQPDDFISVSDGNIRAGLDTNDGLNQVEPTDEIDIRKRKSQSNIKCGSANLPSLCFFFVSTFIWQ